MNRYGAVAMAVALASALTVVGCAGEDASVQGPAALDAAASADVPTAVGDASSSGGASSGGASNGGTSSGGASSGGTSSGGTSGGGTSGGESQPGDLVALTLEPPVATIPVGASLSLDLVGKRADGTTEKLNDVAQWSTSDPDVISLSSTGLALGVGAGSATITAQVSGKLATAQVAVSPKKLASLAVSPQQVALKVGATRSLSAIATMSDGTKDTVTSAVTWASSDDTIAVVNAKGVVTGLAAGAVTISATLGPATGAAEVDVETFKLTALSVDPADPSLTVGESIFMTATATYEDGKVADVSSATTWTSSAPGTVAVTDAGIATAKQVGSATITAVFGGQSSSRVVTVTPATLQSLAVSPATATVAAGGTHGFSVVATMSDGTTKDFTSSVVWSVKPNHVAVISNAPGSTGELTGLAPGTANVIATFGQVSADGIVTVTAATLKSVAIDGGAALAKGVQKQLKATGTYSDGKTLDVTAKVTWQSSNEKVLTVNNADKKGWVAALAEGKATVSASLNGVVGKVALTVSAAALIKVSIAPAAATLEAGQKQAFNAKAQYSDGAVIDVTKQVVWSSTDPATVSVSNAKGSEGAATALKAGSVTIKASLGSTSASAKVTVKQPTLVELTIGPHNLTRKAGQYVQYWAIAVYSNKQTQNVTKQASWSTSDAGVATIQNQGNWKGVAQAKKVGSATISVKYAGKTASTKLTVTNPTIVSVQVSPAAWESPVGVPMRFQAVALFSDDSSQNVTWQATWASSNKTVAQVGNKGGGGGFGGGQPNKGATQALTPGKTEISATYKGKTGKATLTVTAAKPSGLQIFPGTQTMPAGDFRKFEASLLWSDGKSNQATNWVSWTSSDSTVAAALNGNGQKGLVQGLKPGTATITAAGQGFKATATIVVTDATIKTLQLTPAVATVAKGIPVAYRTAAVFSDGQVMDVTWQTTFTSSDPTVATVSNANGGQKGRAQTLKAGKVTIKAAAKGMTATATLTVKPAELKELQVTPVNPKIAIGAFAKLDAVAIFTDGTTQQVTPLATWLSSKANVAAVSNLGQPPGKGFVQGLSAGTSTVSAQWGGKTAATDVTVQTAALIEIQVTPFAPVLPVGYPTQFAATGVFADNTTQNLTGQVSWTSSNTKVASVMSANSWGQKGRVTPLSAGETDIIATFAGKQGKTKLKVSAATLKSITVQPKGVQLKVQQQKQLVAEGMFSDGTKLMLNPYVLWKSSNTGVAPVSNAGGSKGVVKGISKGQATVSAVQGKVTGEAKVTVQ